MTFKVQKGNPGLYKLLLILFLFSLASTAHAADVLWNGGGSDELASNLSNWTAGIMPQDNDAVIFDNTSTKDCTWDADLIPASLNLNPGYTGTVTLNSELMVKGSVTVSDGLLIITSALQIGVTIPPNAPTGLTAFTVSSSQIDLSWTDNSNNETGFKIERKTGINGSYSQIDSVGANVTTYINTGLSAATTYYYRVKAYNAAGESAYSNEANATTSTPSLITLTITSPPYGATINGPDIGVMGTVTNAGGYETGVTVNSIVAAVYDNQYTTSHVPLTDGANTITVTARDTAGNTATAAITVNAVTTGNYITITSDTESGIAPLEATLRIDGSFSIDNSTITVTGPAQPQIVNVSPSEYTVTMTTPGIYYFAATVTGPDGYVYQDTVAVTVLNQTQLDSVLKGIWNAMTTSLNTRDITTAITYMSPATRSIYAQMLNAIIDQLPAMVATQTEFNFVSTKNNVAFYELVTLENGEAYSYEVIFIKDTNGLWYIQDF